MAKIENKSRQNPKLVQVELQDGRASLSLEFYLGRSETPVLDENGEQVLYDTGPSKGRVKYSIKHIRRREKLNLYIWLKPRNAQERLQNKNTLQLAEKIRFEKEQEFLESREGYRLKGDTEIDFLKYFREQHCNSTTFTRGIKEGYKTSYKRLIGFLESTPKYKKFSTFLRMDLIDTEMVMAYAEYCKKVGTGEGPKKSLHWFHRVVLNAIDAGYMKKDPCKGVSIKFDVNVLTKDILTMEEIRRMMVTHYEKENETIRRAFLFSCFTGIRKCDIIRLTYSNIDFGTMTLRFNQQKIEWRSAHSGVVMPLNEQLMKLIGDIPEDRKQRIFQITSDHRALHRHLNRWTKAAGINKHITWHCARHSFAVNILDKGADIKTVSSLMGHASLKMTEKYLHVVDARKQQAIDSLGEITL
ncbi:MAG: site-specific integrase [Muribaculum sp.]|nr:site-specific integrase [Muribaculum sp.]